MWQAEPFGHTADGRPITRLVGQHGSSPQVSILDRGATIQSITVADADVAVSLANQADYDAVRQFYIGSVVGRYANRIRNGRFAIDGVSYQTAPNEGANTLHGGPDGFDQRLWEVESVTDDRLVLRLTSDDGDQGFPGQVVARAAYRLLTDGVELALSATTNAPTVALLTSHLYLNLDGGGDICGHRLTLAASRFVEIGSDLLPTGHLLDVAGTPFDFREGACVGERLDADHPQVRVAGGIDHSFDIDGEGFRPHAVLESEASGRRVELWSDQPGLQVFAAGIEPDSAHLADGAPLARGFGLALEPQQHPDSPNQRWASDCVLRSGETWTSRMQWRFGTIA